jgi:DNA-binding XRE family transcriptional regulator
MACKNKLRELRDQYSIVQQEITVVGKISGSTVVAIEKHGLYPSEETRNKLAQVLTAITGVLITEQDIWPSVDCLTEVA